ncbi:hypothetical protein E2C01_071318 [Portunus trituberculatus]|uniref:Uncharacterized protein n=1 Tax=Portunus trituberculatus TaxID=210409 RepID=A0A5B7I3M9_PORTR|nr:hypothetical protein [Portunus trituberculatus]
MDDVEGKGRQQGGGGCPCGVQQRHAWLARGRGVKAAEKAHGARQVYLLECEAERGRMTGHSHCLLLDEAFPPQWRSKTHIVIALPRRPPVGAVEALRLLRDLLNVPEHPATAGPLLLLPPHVVRGGKHAGRAGLHVGGACVWLAGEAS